MKITSPYSVLLKPVLSEDSTTSMEREEPTYIFRVAVSANKVQIAQAVEDAFGVEVKRVNTLRQMGKIKSLRGQKGRRSEYKKAFVTLEKGNSIELF